MYRLFISYLFNSYLSFIYYLFIIYLLFIYFYYGPNVMYFGLGITQGPKYFSVVIIAFQKMHSLCSLLLRRVQQQTNERTTTNNSALVARGGRKNSIPAMNLDTLRGRRKGDPQHKCCGKKKNLLNPKPDKLVVVFACRCVPA